MVQTAQDGLGQNPLIVRNSVPRDPLHRDRNRLVWYSRPQAGVRSAPVVMSHPLLKNSLQVSLVERNQEIQTLPPDRSD